MKKKFSFMLLLATVAFTAGAVDLDSSDRDPQYVGSIVDRSRKIVDKLALSDTTAANEVTKIIANRYFKLNDIYTVRDEKVKTANETLTAKPSRRPSQRLKTRKTPLSTAATSSFPPTSRSTSHPSKSTPSKTV